MAPGAMPDSIVSACNALDGVEVLWISRYAAGGNLFLDLEVVEELTAHPTEALDRVVDLLPITFRVRLGRAGRPRPTGVIERQTERCARRGSVGTSSRAARPRLRRRRDPLWRAPRRHLIVLGRRGGPEFLESELARLGHLPGLAVMAAPEVGFPYTRVTPVADRQRTVIRCARAGTAGSSRSVFSW